MKPFSLSVLLLLSALAATAEVVMVSGTVYDVGKGSYSAASGVPGGDNLMCWAATSANLLQHWQDEYLQDFTLSDGRAIPNGYATTVYQYPSGTRYLNIYNALTANLTNKPDALRTATNWYGNGNFVYDAATKQYVATSGGYLRDYGLQASEWVWGTSYSNNFQGMAEFKRLLDNAFQYNGYGVFLSLEVDLNSNTGHAITCWGYETDESGQNITALYVSDSDDHQFGARRLDVTQEADGYITFSSNYNFYSDSAHKNYVTGVSYITSIKAQKERTDNTTMPADGVLTGAVNISGQHIASSTGITAEAGSILAATTSETILELGPASGASAGNGLDIQAGALLALDKASVNISRFSGNGLSVSAEANIANGSVTSTYNGGCGVAVQGTQSDNITFLKLAGNSVVDIEHNGSHGIYVEGQMLLDNNVSVSIKDNDGAGIAVQGSLAALTKNKAGTLVTGRSTFDITRNTDLEITGNKQGGINIQSSVSNGQLHQGTAYFEKNGSILISGNSAANGAGAYSDGILSFNLNPELTFKGNTATGNGGAIYSKRETEISGSNVMVKFEGNTAQGNGGAIYANGGVTLSQNGTIGISGNKAAIGSACYVAKEVVGGYGYVGSLSMTGNGKVSIDNNVSSGADVIWELLISPQFCLFARVRARKGLHYA